MKMPRWISSWMVPKSAEAAETQLPPQDVNALAKVREFVKYSEFRQLLDQISLAQKTEHIQSIAVLSEFQGEGKTFITAALAIGYSELLRSNALVIDTTTFLSPSSLPLDRVLEPDDISSKDGLVRHTLLMNVDTIRIRDGNPDGRGGEEFRVEEILEQNRSRFGLTLVDTSAMSARNRNNINPLSVARRCQAAILVISQRSATRGGLAKIQERLEREKIPLLGIVHNIGVAR